MSVSLQARSKSCQGFGDETDGELGDRSNGDWVRAGVRTATTENSFCIQNPLSFCCRLVKGQRMDD